MKEQLMEKNKNSFCVILAGGMGRRLWPCSREHFPKQFMDFFGTGRTQLQQTFDRFARFIPQENIFISTNIAYLHLVREQLPEVSEENIIAEPIHRNTAPSVAWAIHRIARLKPQANLVVTPSDQMVFNEATFQKNIEEGLDFVEHHDSLLTMGVRPTRPEPGYGYIQMGEQMGTGNLYKVQSFTEKPERDFATIFMQSGEFLWNTGLFLSNICYLRSCFYDLLPSVLRTLDAEIKGNSVEEETAYMMKNFPSYPNLSVDYGILEKSENVYVMQCSFGWADVGTWHGIYEAMQRGEGDNVVIDSDVMMEDCKNNVVKLENGKFAVINGLDGYIVAEKGNVLLICKKEDSSALLRKYISEVSIRKGDGFV